MKILIAGGTGLIGTHLIKAFSEDKNNHKITVLSRAKKHINQLKRVSWDDKDLPQAIKEHDIIINLTGASIFDKRWTNKRKKVLEESRIHSTRRLVNMINASPNNHTLLQGSAIGFYGFSGDPMIDEAGRCGKGYLSNLCRRWENEARKLKGSSRLILLRTGVVLSKDSGAFPKMCVPFRLGLGGPLASGSQWFSWIHIADLVSMIIEALKSKHFKGVLNATAPEPLTNVQTMRSLGRAMHRLSFIKTPHFILNFLLGERALLLSQGQRIIPKRSREFYFNFQYPVFEKALEDLLNND